MGVFTNAITHAKIEYRKRSKKDPLFLLLSEENLRLLLHEALNDHKIKVESVYDSLSRKQIRRFAGLEIVVVRIFHQGNFGWALGD
jgi:hypothetical protein